MCRRGGEGGWWWWYQQIFSVEGRAPCRVGLEASEGVGAKLDGVVTRCTPVDTGATPWWHLLAATRTAYERTAAPPPPLLLLLQVGVSMIAPLALRLRNSPRHTGALLGLELLVLLVLELLGVLPLASLRRTATLTESLSTPLGSTPPRRATAAVRGACLYVRT